MPDQPTKVVPPEPIPDVCPTCGRPLEPKVDWKRTWTFPETGSWTVTPEEPSPWKEVYS